MLAAQVVVDVLEHRAWRHMERLGLDPGQLAQAGEKTNPDRDGDRHQPILDSDEYMDFLARIKGSFDTRPGAFPAARPEGDQHVAPLPQAPASRAPLARLRPPL